MLKAKQILLDYVLPSAVVISTGLITYALSGGVEEYPELEDPLFNEENCIDNEEEIEDSNAESTATSVYSVDTSNNNSCEPDWAQELIELTKSLVQDMKEVKNDQQELLKSKVCPKCQEKITNEEPTVSLECKLAPAVTKKHRSSSQWLCLVHQNLFAFSCGNMVPKITGDALYKHLQPEMISQLRSFQVSFTVQAMNAACSALLMYIGNVIKHPEVPRYRRISTTNGSFKNALSAMSGYHLVLEAAGFVRKGSYFEWEWHGITTAGDNGNRRSAAAKGESKEKSGSQSLPLNSALIGSRGQKSHSVRFADSDGNVESCADIEELDGVSVHETNVEFEKQPIDKRMVQTILEEVLELLEGLKKSRDKFIDLLVAKTVSGKSLSEVGTALPPNEEGVQLSLSNKAGTSNTSSSTAIEHIYSESQASPVKESSKEACLSDSDNSKADTGATEKRSMDMQYNPLKSYASEPNTPAATPMRSDLPRESSSDSVTPAPLDFSINDNKIVDNRSLNPYTAVMGLNSIKRPPFVSSLGSRYKSLSLLSTPTSSPARESGMNSTPGGTNSSKATGNRQPDSSGSVEVTDPTATSYSDIFAKAKEHSQKSQ